MLLKFQKKLNDFLHVHITLIFSHLIFFKKKIYCIVLHTNDKMSK
jgi:hypothetical protein